MVASWAHADQVNLSASHDNTLYQDLNGALSNGAGEFFFAGNSGGATPSRRGLIAFDLSAFPINATINSVTLTLHMSMTSSGAQDVAMHRVLSAWGEGASDASGGEGGGIAAAAGDATWLHTFFNSSFWSNPGGDFDAAASAISSVNAVGFYSWSSAQMIADVQNWLTNPTANFGWLLRGNESIVQTTKRFDSRESLIEEFRPELTIDYTPVPGPAAICILLLHGGFTSCRRSR